MCFVFHHHAGMQEIMLEGDGFFHAIIVRRMHIAEHLYIRNLRDSMLYTYEILSIAKKSARLMLISKQDAPNTPSTFSHIIWAITHAKTIYKALPSLNELGLGKLSLFWSDFSQKTHSIDIEKLRKILIGSCEQCGRSNLCEIEVLDSTEAALSAYPQAVVLDMQGIARHAACYTLSNGIIIGAEGGFSQKERALFSNHLVIRFDTKQILRSQTAALALLAQAI